jgi:hypothetical protein
MPRRAQTWISLQSLADLTDSFAAVLTGIARNCTSGLAAFRRANRMEHCGVDAGLKTPAQTSIVIA